MEDLDLNLVHNYIQFAQENWLEVEWWVKYDDFRIEWDYWDDLRIRFISNDYLVVSLNFFELIWSKEFIGSICNGLIKNKKSSFIKNQFDFIDFFETLEKELIDKPNQEIKNTLAFISLENQLTFEQAVERRDNNINWFIKLILDVSLWK